MFQKRKKTDILKRICLSIQHIPTNWRFCRLRPLSLIGILATCYSKRASNWPNSKAQSGQIPNPLLLIAPIVIRESVASSNIENINTTLADVLQWQLFPESEQRPPDKEVLRYR